MFRRVIDDTRFHTPILLSLCLLLYIPFSGARDFWEHENHYAEVMRVMLLEGNYLLPKLNETVWADNPPLFFWLTLLFSGWAGQVSEWSMRLLPALSGAALIVTFYLCFRRKFGDRMVFIAAMVLGSSLLTVHVARHIPINMIFFLFLVISMFFFMEVLAFHSRRWTHIYGAWFFLALACLTKGPFTVLFPATVIGLYLLTSRNWKKVLALRPLTGGLFFLTVTVPWFAYAVWKTSGAWSDAFLAHQYFWHVSGHLGHNLQAVFYSAVSFPLYFLPWSFLFVPAMISLWPEKAKIADGPILFLVLWGLSIFFFYPFYGEEHSHYLFLTFFPAALALGVFLDRIIFSTPTAWVRGWTHGFLIFCSCFIVIASVVGTAVTALQWPDMAWKVGVVGFGLLVTAAWLMYALRNRNYCDATFGLAVLLVVPNLFIQGLVLPTANRLEGRPFAEEIGAVIKPGSQVAIYERKPFYDFNFYSRIQRFEVLKKLPELEAFLSRPGDRFLLIRRRRLGHIQDRWPDLKVVSTQPVGGSQWWFPLSGRWLLLYSCNGTCESIPISAQSENLSDFISAASHEP